MNLTIQKKSLDSHKLIPGEVPFDVGEMFFSRTDDAGIIASANPIFRRVSGHELDALQGAPHQIVRHPDMPRAVFHLMWRSLQSGQSFGAYFKNKSKDGRFYWVFSVTTPTEGGYSSIQIKPTSALHQKIIPLYEEILAAEQGGLSADDSAALLLRRLEDMGFASYLVFVSIALCTEMQERAKRTERPLETWQNRFQSMAHAILQIQQETDEMLGAFRQIRTVPMNMRILASRLENAGGPISAISVNYGSMLDEMTKWVQTFTRGTDSPFSRIRDSILSGQFLAFVALIETDMAQVLTRQNGTNHGLDIPAETQRLRRQAKAKRADATQALKVVEVEAGNLARSVLDMKRYVTGLSSTRMMCKIESATLEHSGEALAGIVDQLDFCQNAIETRLSRISEFNGLIQSNTAMLRATA